LYTLARRRSSRGFYWDRKRNLRPFDEKTEILMTFARLMSYPGIFALKIGLSLVALGSLAMQATIENYEKRSAIETRRWAGAQYKWKSVY
jgi:hypothetical protein